MSFLIRPASVEDLHALVNVHVTSWNLTYPDYHPKPSVELRTKQWRKAFSEPEDNWFCYLAEIRGGEIAGFATGNDFHDEKLPFNGQLNKIHILKKYHRMGIGKKLVATVVKHFLQNGIHSMILFSDPQNPNIRFYDILDGERLPDERGVFQGAFGWKNIEKLTVDS
jgi:ribosomal protein S18 acetylase RimI-like enzyme